MSDEELDRLLPELNNILGWIEQLAEVDTDGVEPLTAVIDQKLRLRDDAVTDGVYAADPYAQHAGRDTRNDGDPFFSPAAVLRLAPDGGRWLGALVLGVP